MKDNKSKKYIEIAENIKKRIVTGEFIEGDRIPSIRKLAKDFNVNPQTVNKATSILASQGYLVSRQGAGSIVSLPKGVQPQLYPGRHTQSIVMLTDKARSRLIGDPLEHAEYHCKDIYLSFLSQMGDGNRSANFSVYEKSDTLISDSFKQLTEGNAGFIVQGDLPNCYFEYFSEHKIPFVLINRVPPSWFRGGYGSVMIPMDKLTDAMNYLISLGHRKILYLFSTDLELTKTRAMRLEILQKAAKEWDEEVVIKEFDFLPGGTDAHRTLSEYTSEGFTASIGFNDVSALGIYPIVKELGLSIPRDFSVIGFDDIFLSQVATPPLTTVRIDRNLLVQWALSILSKMIKGDAGQQIIETLPSELVFRRSAAIKK